MIKWFSRQVLMSLMLVCASSILGLIMMELILRYTERSKNAQTDIRLFQKTASGPCQLRPNLRVTTTIGREDKLIAINSVGMHWREVSLEKPGDKKRIAFVGDSFTFGEWASRVEQSFAGVTDEKLTPHGFEVLNFGVPNDGFGEAEVRLKEQILAYQPDYVLLMSYVGNDFSDTYLGVDRTDCVTGKLRKDAWAMIPTAYHVSPRKALTIYLDQHFATIRALRHVKGRLLSDARFMQASDDTILLTEPRVDVSFFDTNFWLQTPYPPVAVLATDAVRQSLERIRQLVRAHGAELIMMTIPFRAQVYASRESGENYHIAQPQRHIEAFAAQHKIPYYDLLPPLRQYAHACQAVLYTPSDSHFNDLGHRVSGELISRFLARQLGLPVAAEADEIDCIAHKVVRATP